MKSRIIIKLSHILILQFTVILSLYSQNITPIDVSESLINTTIRIECIVQNIENNQKYEYLSTGTGFFFEFNIDNILIPVIVTNYHVIENSKSGKLTFTNTDNNNMPEYGKKATFLINDFKDKWIKHPTEDLAIMPIDFALSEIIKTKLLNPFLVYYVESLIPTEDFLKDITSIEEVIMVGYPKGIWDSTNNLPIVRRGLTATPLKINHNGKPNFLVDIPIFPGSSGSPILIYNNGNYSNKDGSLVIASRISLIGINSMSYNYTAEGELILPPGNPRIQTSTSLPINLAIAIKSSELLKFKPILRELYKQ